MRLYDENSPWRRLIKDEVLAQWPDDIVLVDSTQLDSCTWPIDQCIVVSDKVESKDLITSMRERGVGQFVQLSNPKLNSSIQLAANIIAKPAEVVASPAAALFGSQGTSFQIEAFPFRSSKQKNAILKQVQDHVETFVKSSHVVTNVHMISDELFTNAIFGAPVDSKGRHKNSQLRRSATVELDPDASAQMIIACNEQLLFVACEDSYGSLSLPTVVGRLTACIEKGVGQAINLGEGGSGIGCFLVVENTSSLFILVQPGKKTIVGGVIHYTLPERLRSTIPKNLHIGIAPAP